MAARRVLIIVTRSSLGEGRKVSSFSLEVLETASIQ